MGALRYHYYEIRTVDGEGHVQLTGRSYVRERTKAELYAIQMATGGPTAKVKYLGGGTHPHPSWWLGPRETWAVFDVEDALQ